jgi:hypothetical protein
MLLPDVFKVHTPKSFSKRLFFFSALFVPTLLFHIRIPAVGPPAGILSYHAVYMYIGQHQLSLEQSRLVHLVRPIWLRVGIFPMASHRLLLTPLCSLPHRIMGDYTSSYTAVMLSRRDDHMSIALRSGGALELEDLVQLQRITSPNTETSSSVCTPTSVFTSRDESSGTKPTSSGTSYPLESYRGKGKAVATYASSLSATHGSGSEAEAEQDHALVGIGQWADEGPATTRPPKERSKARHRPRANRSTKQKKPVIIVQHDPPSQTSPADDKTLAAAHVACSSGKGTLRLRHGVRR